MATLYVFQSEWVALGCLALLSLVGGFRERLGAFEGCLGPMLVVWERALGEFVLSWAVMGESWEARGAV
eukprot:2328499-Pyramimonas_sp.AAC.1